MKQVRYECVDCDGRNTVVNTLAEAQRIKEEGGRYRQIEVGSVSQSEAFCRRGARHAGELK